MTPSTWAGSAPSWMSSCASRKYVWSMRLPDEAGAYADEDADLADLLGELEARGDHGLRRLLAADDLEQSHHVRRAEEVQADDLLRPRGRARDLVDVEGRRVGRQDRVLLAEPVELAEDLPLEAHLLEDGLDDEVDVPEPVPVRRPADAGHAGVHLALGELALAHRRCVVLLDDGEPLVDQALLAVDEDDREARVREDHRDAAAHRPGAEHGDALDGQGRRVGRDVRDLRGLSLGEEDVPERRRLGRGDGLFEELALALESRVERELDGGLDRLDAADRSAPAARPGRRVLRGLLEETRRELRLVDVRREVADARQRALRRDALGEGDGARQQVALDDLVDEPERLGLHGAHGVAAHDHLERLGHADEARQALRPAGSRQDAELDLGEPALRAAHGDAVVAAERELEAAAERRAVQGGDDRLRAARRSARSRP